MAGKICPILTAAVAKAPEPQRVLGLHHQAEKTSGFEVIPCVGTACAFFAPMTDEKGKVLGGECALALIPSSVNMLSNSVREAFTPTPEELTN